MNDLANSAMRSIIKQVARTMPDMYGVAYLRGSINTIAIYLEPDAALVAEAHAAVEALKNRTSTHQGA